MSSGTVRHVVMQTTSRQTLRALRAAASLLVVLVVAPPLAWAQADDASVKAKALFEVGAKQYEAGQYKAAVKSFEEAYNLSKRSGLLFSMGQAYRKQFFFDRDSANLKKSLESYRAYLNADPKGSRRAEASAALKELEPYERASVVPAGCVPCVGPSTSSTAAGAPKEPESPSGSPQLTMAANIDAATVRIDGGEPFPLPYSLDVTPGKHKLLFSAEGYKDLEREVTVTTGLAPVTAELEPKEAKLSVQSEPGAQLLLDGQLVARLPMDGVALVPPGRHVVSVLARGRLSWNEEVTLGRGEERNVSVKLQTTTQRYASYGVLTAGALGLAAGGVLAGFALDAYARATDAQAQIEAGNAKSNVLETYNGARDDWRMFLGSSAASLVVGVGGLLGGGLLFGLDMPTATLPSFQFERQEKKEQKLELGFAPLVAPSLGAPMGAPVFGLASMGRF
jgi:hypothetical protein